LLIGAGVVVVDVDVGRNSSLLFRAPCHNFFYYSGFSQYGGHGKSVKLNNIYQKISAKTIHMCGRNKWWTGFSRFAS
jgi:hypothetical protein